MFRNHAGWNGILAQPYRSRLGQVSGYNGSFVKLQESTEWIFHRPITN
jgi:hypothetical protein